MSLADELIKSVDSMSLDKLLTTNANMRNDCAFLLDGVPQTNSPRSLSPPESLRAPGKVHSQFLPPNFTMDMRYLSSIKSFNSSRIANSRSSSCNRDSFNSIDAKYSMKMRNSGRRALADSPEHGIRFQPRKLEQTRDSFSLKTGSSSRGRRSNHGSPHPRQPVPNLSEFKVGPSL